MVLDGKSSQDYPVDAGVPQGSINDLNDLPEDVTCNIAIYADDTALYSKCDQASNLWQQLELSSELKFFLRDTVDWGRKWFFDFNGVKLNWFCFTGLITVLLLM